MVVSHAIKTIFGQVIRQGLSSWNLYLRGFPAGKSPTSTPSAEKKTCKKNLVLVHLEIFGVDYSYLNIDWLEDLMILHVTITGIVL